MCNRFYGDSRATSCYDKYVALNDKRSQIGMAVVGDPAYGNDSPLYGAMGFVRKSEKKSGLTRKKKP
mgnify:CR=1 FL=1